MKKILLVLLAMTFTLTGCFGKSYSNDEKKDILRAIERTETDDFVDILEKKGYEEHDETTEYSSIYYKEIGKDVVYFVIFTGADKMRNSFYVAYVPNMDGEFEFTEDFEEYFGAEGSIYETYSTEGSECQYSNKLSKDDLKVKKTDWTDDDCDSAKDVEKSFKKLSNKLFVQLDKLVDVKGSNPNFFIMLLNFLLMVGAVAIAIFVKGDNKKYGRIATIALLAIAFLMIILLSYTILPRIFFIIVLLLAAGVVFVFEKYSKQDDNVDSSDEGFGGNTVTTDETNPVVDVDGSVAMAAPNATTTESVKDGVKNVVDGVDSEKLMNDVKDVSAKAVEKSKDVFDVVKKKKC